MNHRVFPSLLALATTALLLLPGTARATIFLSNWDNATNGYRVSSYHDNGTVDNANLILNMGVNGSKLAVAGGSLFALGWSGTVSRYSLNGSLMNANFITGLADPYSLYLAGSANHLLVATDGGTVSQYGLDGVLGSAFNLNSGIRSIAVAGASLFAISDYENTVAQYTLNGTSVTPELITSLPNVTTGLAVAGDRVFLVSDYRSRVVEYNLDGDSINSNFIVSPLGYGSLDGIAYTSLVPAVPEPGRALLLLIGGAGLFLRRRRSVA